MNASNDNSAAKGLRGWWESPPRHGMHRLINPWEYRHLRVSGVTRLAGGSVAAAAGVVCLSYRSYGWGQPSSWFLRRSISRVATGTSLSLAPHLPEPEPGQTPARATMPSSRIFRQMLARDMPSHRRLSPSRLFSTPMVF